MPLLTVYQLFSKTVPYWVLLQTAPKHQTFLLFHPTDIM